MLLDDTDDKSTLVQVMTCCRQATSHYLCQYDTDLCRHMASLGHNELMMGIPASERTVFIFTRDPGGCFDIKMLSHQYKNSHYKDKMVSR